MLGAHTFRTIMTSEWLGILVIMWFLSLYYSLSVIATFAQCMFFHPVIFSFSMWFCLRWSLGSRI